MSRERECSADFHEPDCACERCKRENCGDCKKTNRDHFTAKAVARELGWKSGRVNKEDNIQRLSYECHRDKDSTTPARMELAKRLKRGEKITLEEYLKIIPRKFSD